MNLKALKGIVFLVFCCHIFFSIAPSGKVYASWDGFREDITEDRVRQVLGAVAEKVGEPYSSYKRPGSRKSGAPYAGDCEYIDESWGYPGKQCTVSSSPDIEDTQRIHFSILWFETADIAQQWWASHDPGEYFDYSNPSHPAGSYSFYRKSMQFAGYTATEECNGFDEVVGEDPIATGTFWWRVDRFVFKIGGLYRKSCSEVRDDLQYLADILRERAKRTQLFLDPKFRVRAFSKGSRVFSDGRIEIDISVSVVAPWTRHLMLQADELLGIAKSPGGIIENLKFTLEDRKRGVAYITTYTIRPPIIEGSYIFSFEGRRGSLSDSDVLEIYIPKRGNFRINFEDGGYGEWVQDGPGRWSVERIENPIINQFPLAPSAFSGVKLEPTVTDPNGLAYTMTGTGADDIAYSLYRDSLSDFVFQVDVCKISGELESGYGLYVNSDESLENYYEFSILSDGQYSVAQIVDGDITILTDYSISNALKMGQGEWNTLKVSAKGGNIEFYANGVLVDEIQNALFPEGFTGIFATDSNYSQEPDMVQFDNVFINTDGDTQSEDDEAEFDGWTDDGSGTWSVSEGVYVMTGNKGNAGRYSHYAQEYSDLTLQADVRKTSGDSNSSSFGYGLYFRSDGVQSNYYEFIIVVDGYYQVGKSIDGKFAKLTEITQSDAIVAGYSKWNTLKVVALGNTLAFYANDILLTTIQDDSLTTGKVGLLAIDAASSDSPDIVEFDNVLIDDPESDENGENDEIEPGLSVVISPDTLPADGESTAIITATLGDSSGKPIIGEKFSITLSQKYGSVSQLQGNENGTYTATFKVADQIGVTTIYVNVGSYTKKAEITLIEVVKIRTLSITSAEIAPGGSGLVQISITDATGIASGDIFFEYDESVIAIDDITATELTSDMALIVNRNVSGEIRIAMASGEGLPSTSGVLLDVLITINANAQSDTETTLSLSDTGIYDESGNDIQINLEDGIVKVKKPGIKGDVNNDGNVRSNDATLTLRIAAKLLIPDEYQSWAADMNNDGNIRANDASLILREAAGLAAPGISSIVSSGRRINIMLSETSGVMGERIMLPITVDKPDILASGDIGIAYDSKILRVIDILPNSNVLMTHNILEPGMLRISFANSGRLDSKILAKMQFEVLNDDISPLIFKDIELYGPDTFPLASESINSEFRSWAIPPEHNDLLQNFPNPFNPETWIPYQLMEGSEVTIRIYGITGELTKKLDLGYRSAGIYISRDRAAYWDGKDRFGTDVASGVYFYHIAADGYSATRKMTISK